MFDFLHSGSWLCVSRFRGIEIAIISERRDGIVSALYFCILRRPYRIVDDKRILGIISFTADTEDVVFSGLFEKVIFIHFTSTENDFYFLQCCFPSLSKKTCEGTFFFIVICGCSIVGLVLPGSYQFLHLDHQRYEAT